MRQIAFFILSVALLFAMGCASSNPQEAHASADHEACNHEDCTCGKAEAEQAEKSEEPAPVVFDATPAPGTQATCAVSGEAFTTTEETVVKEHNGRFYAFCCPGCQEKFDAEPGKYAQP